VGISPPVGLTDTSSLLLLLREMVRTQPGHAWVAQHYHWALDQLFHDKQHSHVILVEDDMLFAVDFLRYFEATATLLDVDPTLWCVVHVLMY
jgi:hypothetical protein